MGSEGHYCNNMAHVEVKATKQEGTKLVVEWKVRQSGDWRLCTLTEHFDVTHWRRSWSKKRSDIIHAIIYSQSTEHLRLIVERGWDVNELLKMRTYEYNHWRSGSKFPFKINRQKKTALQVATEYFWQEGVKILIHAGADTKLCPEGLDPLTLTLSKPRTDDQVEAIKLLLEHGADANGKPTCKAIAAKNSPLILAIKESAENGYSTEIVDLLLQSGADPNFLKQGYPPGLPLCTVMECLNLSISLYKIREYARNPQTSVSNEKNKFKTANAKFFRILLNFGADVNLYKQYDGPLLYKIVFPLLGYNEFLPEHLSLYFEHGGDVNRGYRGMEGLASVLDHAIRECGNVNNVRWLIRHGADTTCLQFKDLTRHFIPRIEDTLLEDHPFSETNDTPLVLLEAGMRIPIVLHFFLSGLPERIEYYLGNACDEEENILVKTVKSVFERLKQREAEEWKKIRVRKKDVFPEYQTRQMADLLEFSDETLDMYPDEGYIKNPSKRWQYNLDTINKILEYLAQPRTLQWCCRRSIRESLVSLHPSVVKTLQVPSRLKRFILCHEL